jgi:alanyl-tRNA synthetase
MTAQEIRKKYLEFMKAHGHKVIPPASLVPQNDPTTLFTGSGMQPLLPYLLGEAHPEGTRVADSQPSFRTQDIEEVGDNRHTVFFEMLGNWSLGDYFKTEQLPWIWEFLTNELGLDSSRIYISCCSGFPEYGVPKDTESAGIWKKLFAEKGIEAQEIEVGSEENAYKVGEQNGRIFFYDKKNWWSRVGAPSEMPIGEPGGPDSEMFYRFDHIEHNKKYGENCHPNCDCGRYIELGNSVFMEYLRTEKGFEKLPKQNVDYGGGLERIAAAVIDSPDVFHISVLKPIVEGLEKLSGKEYEQYQTSMRVIADHLRASVFLAANGVVPSNKERGYVMRRLMRRAMRYAFDLGIEQDLCEKVALIIVDLYAPDFPEVAEQESKIIETFMREERIFRQTLRAGVRELKKIAKETHTLTGNDIFTLYDTFGFPVELSLEEAYREEIDVQDDWQKDFDEQMEEQRKRSQTASQGMFKGGLADHSEQVVKYHTTTHLMYQALKEVLGPHVVQRGSNITAERTRFDFSHPEKVNREQLDEVEKIVNQKIQEDLPVTWQEENTQDAFAKGASGAFGDKYGETVKVYTIGRPGEKPFSREICGGPHVEHTGVIAESGKTFKITKEEASSAGVRRIKAVLQ